MTVETIAEAVQDVLQDESYDSTWIVGKFNEALLLVTTMCRIPGLQMYDDVTAAVAGVSVAMPDTYLHDLYLVTSLNFPSGMTIAPNLKELVTRYAATDTGQVEMVALDNHTLNFRPAPTEEETLTVHYYAKPDTLLLGDTFPDYIPEILHKEIFQNYAIKEAYMQIEDGVDGKVPNTTRYAGLFAGGVASLMAFYRNAPKGRVEVLRAGSYY